MPFYKSSVYDHDLHVVAHRIDVSTIVHSQQPMDYSASFIDFLDAIIGQADVSTNAYRMIVPVAFKELVAELPHDVRRRVVLNIDLQASQPENYAIATGLLDSGFQLAVDIQDQQSLSNIPQDANFVILDAAFINLADSGSVLSGLHPPRWLIKNIEDHDTFQALKMAGIGYFSGQFIEKPQPICSKQIHASKVTVLQLLAKLNDPDIELDELSNLITLDNVLSYKLLKITNSPLFRGVNELTTIKDAIIRFGYNNLKKWGLMLSLANITDKPTALTKITVERAILCAKLATKMPQQPATDLCYTAGLFSTLDAFFDNKMDALLNQVALDPQIKSAILNHQGEIGQILKTAINIQHGKIDDTTNDTLTLYLESLNQTEETMKLLNL